MKVNLAWQFREWPKGANEVVIDLPFPTIKSIAPMVNATLAINSDGPLLGQPADTVILSATRWTRGWLFVTLSRGWRLTIVGDGHTYQIYRGGLGAALRGLLCGGANGGH